MSLPAPPNTTPDKTQPAVPPIWQDRERVVATVLGMWSTDPVAALAFWHLWLELIAGVKAGPPTA